MYFRTAGTDFYEYKPRCMECHIEKKDTDNRLLLQPGSMEKLV